MEGKKLQKAVEGREWVVGVSCGSGLGEWVVGVGCGSGLRGWVVGVLWDWV